MTVLIAVGRVNTKKTREYRSEHKPWRVVLGVFYGLGFFLWFCRTPCESSSLWPALQRCRAAARGRCGAADTAGPRGTLGTGEGDGGDKGGDHGDRGTLGDRGTQVLILEDRGTQAQPEILDTDAPNPHGVSVHQHSALPLFSSCTSVTLLAACEFSNSF